MPTLWASRRRGTTSGCWENRRCRVTPGIYLSEISGRLACQTSIRGLTVRMCRRGSLAWVKVYRRLHRWGGRSCWKDLPSGRILGKLVGRLKTLLERCVEVRLITRRRSTPCGGRTRCRWRYVCVSRPFSLARWSVCLVNIGSRLEERSNGLRRCAVRCWVLTRRRLTS